MAGEQLAAGELTFVVAIADAERFELGKPASGKDRVGDPITGLVKRVLHGNQVALVVVSQASPKES